MNMMNKAALCKQYWKPGNIVVCSNTWSDDTHFYANLIIDDELSVGLDDYEPRTGMVSQDNVKILAFYKLGSNPGLGLKTILNNLKKRYQCGVELNMNKEQTTLLWEQDGIDAEWKEMIKELKEKFSWGSKFEKDALSTNLSPDSMSGITKEEIIQHFKDGHYDTIVMKGICWGGSTMGIEYWHEIYYTLQHMFHNSKEEKCS